MLEFLMEHPDIKQDTNLLNRLQALNRARQEYLQKQGALLEEITRHVNTNYIKGSVSRTTAEAVFKTDQQ